MDDRPEPFTLDNHATDDTSLTIFGDADRKGTSKLNIKEMLTGTPVRLRFVRRYSTCRVNHDETVAEHSYYVMLYAALVGQWLQRNPHVHTMAGGEARTETHRLNWELLMIRAAVHDLEESATGDMPRHFKYATPALREAHEFAAEAAFKQVVSKLVSPGWAARLVLNWKLSKDSRLEGKVIAFADFLSVLSFISQECASGNENAFEHASSLVAYFELFTHPDGRFDAFAELVEQTRPIVEELRRAFAE